MTQQARNGYRKHRKATWGFALLVALAIGAIVIPLASGGGGKSYTFSVAPTSFCAGTTNSSTVTITNTARTQSLGSAELFFPAGSLASVTGGYSLAKNVSGSPYYSGNWDIIGGLSNLGLSYGQSIPPITVTYNANAGPLQSGPIQAVVKQANMFNDTSGGANVFDNPSPWPQLSIATCHYVFTQPPTDAQTGAAQTVKVQLQNGSGSVSVSGPLSLGAFQSGTNVNANFSPNPLTSVGGLDGQGGQDAFKTWSFSVTGNVHGDGYTLVAGSDSSNSFNINDCNPTGGTCSTPQVLNGDTSGGYQVSGTGLTQGFDVNFDPSLLSSFASSVCSGEGWSQMTYPVGGTGHFPALTTTTTHYSGPSGYQMVTLYFRNALYVQTSASQTNSIQICAGFQHTNLPPDASTAWTDASGNLAQLETTTGFYWGVLQRIPNCSKNKWPYNNATKTYSPALCAWGTVTIGGIDYRSATVIVPYDWDGHFTG